MSDRRHLTAAASEPKGSPATTQEIAALEFRACAPLRRMSKTQREGRTRIMGENVYSILQIAAGLLVKDKGELVDMVRADHDLWGNLLLSMTEGADLARDVVGIISSAETRLAVAVAEIEKDF